jgi:hypothetical protein
MAPRFYNGIVETPEAGVRVVALLATVVGLHNNSVGLCGYVARAPDLAVKGGGDVVQQCVQGNS